MKDNASPILVNGIVLTEQSIAEIKELQAENGSFINYNCDKIADIVGMLAGKGDTIQIQSAESLLDYIHFLTNLSRIIKQFKQQC